jgi:hypothetical protein
MLLAFTQIEVELRPKFGMQLKAIQINFWR